METLVKSVRKKRLPSTKEVSIDAYFKAEEKSISKHEYHNGKIILMAGGTFIHDNLANKAITFINNFIEENELFYFVNGSDTKISIEQCNKFVYPDAVVICEKPIFYQNRKDTITNPLLIVEVLSDSTKEYDRNIKYELYRALPSFKEYVLIHQDIKLVGVYTKQPDNTWIIRHYEGDEATAILYTIEKCPLSLKRLYRGLDMLY
jgi:Uma2 family endonuclease